MAIEQEFLDPSIWTLVKFGLASGVGAALISLVGGSFKDAIIAWFRNRRVAGATAQQVVDCLTTYAQTCATWSAENHFDFDQSGHGLPYTGMPQLADFPTGPGWEALKPKLAQRCRDLRNAITLKTTALKQEVQVEGGGEPSLESLDEAFGVTGYSALRLAGALRWTYGLGRYSNFAGSNFRSELRGMFKKYYRGSFHRFWYSLWHNHSFYSFRAWVRRTIRRAMSRRS